MKTSYTFEYKVPAGNFSPSLRRSAEEAFMAKHGITKDSHKELDWGFTDATYSVAVTEWIEL